MYEIEQGISELRNNRSVMLMPIILGLSAEANAAAGKVELAHGDIDDGFEVLEKSHYVAWKSHLHLVRGELHLLGNIPDLEQAQKQFATAMDLARAQQVRMIELRAATRLASVRSVTGNADKAVEMLSALYGFLLRGSIHRT